MLSAIWRLLDLARSTQHGPAPTAPTMQCEQAFFDGVRAFYAGLRKADNPYWQGRPHLRQAWDNGYEYSDCLARPW